MVCIDILFLRQGDIIISNFLNYFFINVLRYKSCFSYLDFEEMHCL